MRCGAVRDWNQHNTEQDITKCEIALACSSRPLALPLPFVPACSMPCLCKVVV